jgi:hypothetical protein
MDRSGPNWQVGSGQVGARQCPLWVKSRHPSTSNQCPPYPRKRTSRSTVVMSALCHVWTAPGWQEESSRSRLGRYSHVFGLLNAVHMTAGHNALRGSGPGQNPAFENAMAQVGCPDRRIDRLCFTCCSSSQPSYHAGCRRDLVRPSAKPDNCSARQ